MGPSSISPAILSTQQFDFASTLPPDVPLKSKTAGSVENPEERKLFDQYIAGNFFKQMLAAMRKTTDKPAYFHGGKMEEMILEKFLDPAMADVSG